MRGISDENHTPAMPLIQRHPVDRPAMDLLVTGQRLQIFLDDPTKAGEVATQPVEPTG